MANLILNSGDSFATVADLALVSFLAELTDVPIIGQPDEWQRDLIYTRDSSAKKTVFHIPVHSVGDGEGDAYTGTARRTGTGSVSYSVFRKTRQTGVKASAMRLAELDVEGWDQVPSSLATWAGSIEGDECTKIWNTGYTINDWTKTRYWSVNADKPVCPGRPRYGKFRTAYANSPLTVANIERAMLSVRSRKGFNGKSLKNKPVYGYFPTSMMPMAERLLVTQELLPQVGEGGGDTGGNTNTVLGKLLPVEVQDMRDDLWIVGATPPPNIRYLKPFFSARGGPGNTLGIVKDPAKTGSGVPYLMIITHDSSSQLFKDELSLAIDYYVNVGYKAGSSHCYCANFTGAAS